MKRLILVGLLTAAMVAITSSAFAFSFSVDTPTQYTLNDKTLDTCKNCGKAKADDQTLTNVSGFKVAVASMHHIGVAYEDYDAKGKGTSGGGSFGYDLKLQFYDVVLDLPARWLNFGLGVGMGRANTNITFPGGGSTPIIHSAAASQYFASIGIPLGEHFDVHAEYHVVHMENMKATNVGGTDSLQLSGQTVMAGVRLAW